MELSSSMRDASLYMLCAIAYFRGEVEKRWVEKGREEGKR
jgi:hypothetical protein